MNHDSRKTFPTTVVLCVLVSAYSTMAEVVLLSCQLFLGRRPGNNQIAHYILISVSCGSILFVRFSGQHHFFGSVGQANGCLHLTKMQAVIATIFGIAYPCFVGWALGLIG